METVVVIEGREDEDAEGIEQTENGELLEFTHEGQVGTKQSQVFAELDADGSYQIQLHSGIMQ